jgi:hypothetical protein
MPACIYHAAATLQHITARPSKIGAIARAAKRRTRYLVRGCDIFADENISLTRGTL